MPSSKATYKWILPALVIVIVLGLLSILLSVAWLDAAETPRPVEPFDAQVQVTAADGSVPARARIVVTTQVGGNKENIETVGADAGGLARVRRRPQLPQKMEVQAPGYDSASIVVEDLLPMRTLTVKLKPATK